MILDLNQIKTKPDAKRQELFTSKTARGGSHSTLQDSITSPNLQVQASAQSQGQVGGLSTTSLPSGHPSGSPQVIKRVLHTRTEITIYPNGQTFQNSRSWFEDKVYPVRKKKKKKLSEVKKEKGVVEL